MRVAHDGAMGGGDVGAGSRRNNARTVREMAFLCAM